jgi:hypothetical protein
MKTVQRLLSSCGLVAITLIVFWAVHGRAELPPQYSTWEDFGAVIRQSSIPGTLGVVDRIERADRGRYIVRAGACLVEVVVRREGSKGPDGTPRLGGSRVADVEFGERRCN